MYVSCCASSPNDSWLIRCDAGQIEVLPDNVLLAIFDYFMVGDQSLQRGFLRSEYQPPTQLITTGTDFRRAVEWWQPLVRVCRRWRGLVFQSPHRLNLQLCCMLGSVTRKTVDVWPALPLLIMNDYMSNKP